jgi:hypothetical protein
LNALLGLDELTQEESKPKPSDDAATSEQPGAGGTVKPEPTSPVQSACVGPLLVLTVMIEKFTPFAAQAPSWTEPSWKCSPYRYRRRAERTRTAHQEAQSTFRRR